MSDALYHPYFRGKQFELIAIRETAELIAEAGFTPIIEPVKESLASLERALKELIGHDARAIVIINPGHGDHKLDSEAIGNFLEQNYRNNDAVRAGVLLRPQDDLTQIRAIFGRYSHLRPVAIHAGAPDPRGISSLLSELEVNSFNIFLENSAGMLYRKHFRSSDRVLIRDGFDRRKNADYGPVDAFSDLHATYRDIEMVGYGDFLTVGDTYSEGGGPAYAVAIHLTYIDSEQDDAMYVYHFVSDTNDTPTDPAGKFAQALEKLIKAVDSGGSMLHNSESIAEFRQLYERGHFPGLGYVKKLSIKHHIETLAAYEKSRAFIL